MERSTIANAGASTGAVGRVRRVVENGREYLVAPLSLIVPGVLAGSKGALYYPPDEIARNHTVWDGTPIVVYHPHDPLTNQPQSVWDRGVIERAGVGEVRSSRVQGGSGVLRAEGWFDSVRTREVDPRVHEALVKGRHIELSTGLYTDNHSAPPGSVHVTSRGPRGYDYIARNYRPDHVAILPDQVGACSVKDGCGVFNRHECTEGCGCMPDTFNTGDGQPGFDSEEQAKAFFGLKKASDEAEGKKGDGGSRADSSNQPTNYHEKMELSHKASEIEVHKGFAEAKKRSREVAKDYLDQVERKRGASYLRGLAIDHGVSLQVNPGGKGLDTAHAGEITRRLLDKTHRGTTNQDEPMGLMERFVSWLTGNVGVTERGADGVVGGTVERVEQPAQNTTSNGTDYEAIEAEEGTTDNGFCPTGKGGGSDNSCPSRKGAGGGSGAAKAPAVPTARLANPAPASKQAPKQVSTATKSAVKQTSFARDKSEKAQGGSMVDHAVAAHAHQVAKASHVLAAAIARGRGDHKLAAKHIDQAEEHGEHADWHDKRSSLWGKFKGLFSRNESAGPPTTSTDEPVTNAGINQPRHGDSGQYLPHGAGTGKGPAHKAATRGGITGRVTMRQVSLGHDALKQLQATGHNPASWVQDEDKWEKAKEQADKGDYDKESGQYWAVVTHIYENMGGEIKEGKGDKGSSKSTTNADDTTEPADTPTASTTANAKYATHDGRPCDPDEDEDCEEVYNMGSRISNKGPGFESKEQRDSFFGAIKEKGEYDPELGGESAKSVGSNLSDKAVSKSNAVSAFSGKADDAKGHQEAAIAHDNARLHHERQGNAKLASSHGDAANYHHRMAEELHARDKKWATEDLAEKRKNFVGEKVRVGNKNMANLPREELLDYISLNCDCSDDDRAALNGLSDTVLGRIANATSMGKAQGSNATTATGRGSTPSLEEQTDDGDMDGDEAQTDDDMTQEARGGAKDDRSRMKNNRYTSNSRRRTVTLDHNGRMPLDDFMEIAPEQVHNLLSNAMQVEQQARTRLVKGLTEHLADGPQKRSVVNRLKGKTIDELQDLALIQPTGNRQRMQLPQELSYLGAAAPLFNGGRTQADRDDYLALPTMNWGKDEDS